jgi:ArsR family transcriptional regulator
MDMEELLDMLGNETRRGILQMLSRSPCYVSELSQQLNIGQKAIIEHLELMRQAGILETEFKKMEKGRPRKYYLISKDVSIEIRISQDSFTVETLSLANKDVLDSFPRLKKITKKLEETLKIEGEERICQLERIYEELKAERKNAIEARKIVEFLLRKINAEIRRSNILSWK